MNFPPKFLSFLALFFFFPFLLHFLIPSAACRSSSYYVRMYVQIDKIEGKGEAIDALARNYLIRLMRERIRPTSVTYTTIERSSHKRN